MNDILIHVRDFTEPTPAVRFGIRLAARFNAAATGVFAYPAPIANAPAMNASLMAAVAQGARDVEDHALQARQAFLDRAATQGVQHAQWLVAEGAADRALAQASTRHDLLVLDHAGAARPSISDISDIILGVCTPCIVVAHDEGDPAPIERIAVAWNGSPEAARAMHAALPFMRGKQVLLMVGEVRDTYHGVTWKTPFDVADYLQRHEVSLAHASIDADGGDAGRALLDEAMQFRADLMVMGAYGRNRFSEWLLGGATRHALAAARIPVLLQH